MRARIAAVLGGHDEAVRRLRQAVREGHPLHTAAHAAPGMRALQRHAGFRKFMRPAG
jgi:hypothetical protein